MVVFKCKMCGGDLNIIDGEQSVCECEYCGSKQTVPKVDNEKMAKLYQRANRLRIAGEFDKAATVYEGIIEESDMEAEAYWGLMLCKYGIEYVDDPVTGDKVPTCHRSSFDSIMEDEDFDMVMENADTYSRTVYREQAKQIEEIRKGIIEISGKEAPYDIFICYKETDDLGQRTVDSVIAQDVYDALTAKGYRVFFSRISLEDKLGTEYEPYIFAALNSAKVMLAFGTSYDNYNAVWVKNEWSRFLKIMAKNKDRYLIPCFKDIDAYDMPKEFAKLQAQDMGKVGATQDLMRGLDKILDKAGKKPNQGSDVLPAEVVGGANISVFLKRAAMALEDLDFEKADRFAEEALNINPESGEAYLYKFMAHYQVNSVMEFKTCEKPRSKKIYSIDSIKDDPDYKKIAKFGGNNYIEEINKYADYCRQYNGYALGKKLFEEKDYVNAKQYFERLRDFKDCQEMALKCDEKILEREQEQRKTLDVIRETVQLEAFGGKEKVLLKMNNTIDAVKERNDSLRQEITELRNSLKGHSINECSIQEVNEETKKLLREISLLKEEISNLGIFAKKEKEYKHKQLNEKTNRLQTFKNIISIAVKEKEIKENENRVEIIMNAIPGISQCNGTLSWCEERIEEEEIRKLFSANFPVEKMVWEGRGCIAYSKLYFGKYNDRTLEWKILEQGGECKNKLKLVLNWHLGPMQYHEKAESVDWRASTLHDWLNGEFYEEAFSDSEKKMIIREIAIFSEQEFISYTSRRTFNNDNAIWLRDSAIPNSDYVSDNSKLGQYKMIGFPKSRDFESQHLVEQHKAERGERNHVIWKKAFYPVLYVDLQKADFDAYGGALYELAEKNNAIDVDLDKCIGCGACIKLCPRNAISFVENSRNLTKKAVSVSVDCDGCRQCINICKPAALY